MKRPLGSEQAVSEQGACTTKPVRLGEFRVIYREHVLHVVRVVQEEGVVPGQGERHDVTLFRQLVEEREGVLPDLSNAPDRGCRVRGVARAHDVHSSISGGGPGPTEQPAKLEPKPRRNRLSYGTLACVGGQKSFRLLVEEGRIMRRCLAALAPGWMLIAAQPLLGYILRAASAMGFGEPCRSGSRRRAEDLHDANCACLPGPGGPGDVGHGASDWRRTRAKAENVPGDPV